MDSLVGGNKPKKKWTTFIHNGVLFNPPYQRHGIPVMFNGSPIILSTEAEEMATLYAKTLDTEYVNNSRFNRNFWKSWKVTLKDTEITELAGCDFSKINQHLVTQRKERMAVSKEERKRLIEERKQILENFRTAKVDDREEVIGNILVEPTGLFIGRGCHPKLGTVKKRINPEDVTLNLDRDAPTPKIMFLSDDNQMTELVDHRWGEIIHDNKLEWIASWTDTVMGKRKYVWLDHSSSFRATSDMKKFELARKLKKKIHHIREQTTELLYSKEKQKAQLATAVFLIDKLALRVGNEKGRDEADTVGVSSLRVEHINFEGKDTIVLDFLGKDSMRYFNSVKIHQKVYNNLLAFVASKQPDEPLFDQINSNDLNEYLQTLMKGLTAKSFRTFNASQTFQYKLNKVVKKYEQELPEADWDPKKLKEIMDMFERANIEVAKLCNHQKKTVSGLKNQLDGIRGRIEELRKQKRRAQSKKRTKTVTKRITRINDRIRQLKATISLKNELKNISLATSKVNYIDPRIAFAFAKKLKIPTEKIYSSTLRKKFTGPVK